MKLDREIVDRFLAGQEIADSWVFSEIEEGRRCFDLSDATGREREIRELTQQVSERNTRSRVKMRRFTVSFSQTFKRSCRGCRSA